jgi:transcriptional regulator with XRE-family HTH domain
MRISIGPRPEVTVRPEIRAHRPPDEYISLLTKSESEFRKYIRDIESDPVFEKLLNEGWVRKVHFRGRIPHHLYQEFQDRQFVEFLQKYDITSKVGWEEDFFDRNARSKAEELAVKYKVPRGELIRSLEYCRHLRLSWDGYEDEVSEAFLSLDEPGNFRPPEASEISVQSDESVAVLADLMERYSISEGDFVEHFLSVSPEPFDIARELGIDANAVEDILEILEKVQILDAMQVNVVDHRDATRDTPLATYSKEARSIAVVRRLKDPPRVEIQIDADEQYGSRYDVEEPDGHVSREEAALIERLKMINQRRSLTFRVISFICEFQYPYFVSGDPLRLKPLSQAQIAREVGEQESTISRILRNRSLETSEGVLPIKFFCQSKKEVIERIIQIREKAELAKGDRCKPFNDAEIADILEKEYDTKVSRRTVTYYRNKIEEAPRFYKRRKQALEKLEQRNSDSESPRKAIRSEQSAR